jgi:hypothetical protein
MTMASVQLEGVYQLPRGLGVTEKSLGKTLALEVGGVSGNVLLPRLVWSGDEPRVEAPAVDSAPLEAMGPQIAMSGQLGFPPRTSGAESQPGIPGSGPFSRTQALLV